MQKQPSKGFFNKGVIRNFAESTRKHVLESLFLIKFLINFFDKLCRSGASLKTRL